MKKVETIFIGHIYSDPVLGKLNTEFADEEYSTDFFDKKDWSKQELPSNVDLKVYKRFKNIMLYANSNPEKKFIDYLIYNSKAERIVSQWPIIPYDTEESYYKKYFIDFTILTKDNKLALVEIKELLDMTYHINIAKYRALKKFAQDRGCAYMMYDPETELSFEDLDKIEIPKIILDKYKEWYNNTSEDAYFKDSDFNEWCESLHLHSNNKRKLAAAFVKKYNLHNKGRHGLLVYKSGFDPNEFDGYGMLEEIFDFFGYLKGLILVKETWNNDYCIYVTSYDKKNNRIYGKIYKKGEYKKTACYYNDEFKIYDNAEYIQDILDDNL